MKKFLSVILAGMLVALSAFGAVNPNQILGYQTVFTGTNVIVNGGIEISQVLGTASGVPATGSYPVDNVRIEESTASVFSTVRVDSTNVATYTAGYLGSLGATGALQAYVNATHGAPAAADEFALYFAIEGLNFSRFQYGTANAKAGSLQFKVRCSVSGTYSGAVKNYANTRAYPFSYACTSGGDQQVYVQNIPGDTGGTWVGNTNAGAAYVTFDLGSGSNYLSTAGTWQTGNYNGVTGQTAMSAQANGASLTITDVQFEVGSFGTQFERKLYGQVLAEAQRYLPVISGVGLIGTGYAYDTSHAVITFRHQVPTRVQVTGVVFGAIGNLTVLSGITSYAVSAGSLQFGGTYASMLNLVSAGISVGGAGGLIATTTYVALTGAQI
jgi:hypothetical protein